MANPFPRATKPYRRPFCLSDPYDRLVDMPTIKEQDNNREAQARVATAKRENSTSLDLSGLQLSELPPEIASLDALENLHLQSNHLTTLPPEIASLKSLMRISLNYNQFSTLPREIASLTKLRILFLEDNQLTSLSPEIASLTALRILYLSNNQITSLPPEIASLSSLEQLFLHDNQLNSLPPALRQLSELRRLTLHGNPRLKLSPTILGPDPAKSGFDVDELPSAKSILDFYFGRLVSSTRPLNEVKLILVGRGGAGKTSIAHALQGWEFDPFEASTPGITLSDWSMRGARAAKSQLMSGTSPGR